MTPKGMQKTSVQLSPDALKNISWPGLSRSEAIRLSVDRQSYFASINSQKISSLADRFRPILEPALAEFSYDDFRVIARSLPAIVEGYCNEGETDDTRTDEPYESATELLDELKKLSGNDRVGILDCIVAGRTSSHGK